MAELKFENLFHTLSCTPKKFLLKLYKQLIWSCHDTQHNAIQLKDSEYNAILHNDTKHNGLICDTQDKCQSALTTLSITMLCHYAEHHYVQSAVFYFLLC
jgi:hypothetical protein